MQNPSNTQNEIDADVGNIFEKLDSWLDGFFRLLPNLGVAIALLAGFIALAYFVARMIRGAASQRGRESLGEVGGSLTKWTVVLLGVMLAVTVVVPSVTPGDILAGLGVGSVAIGFAFKDILQNLLAGILILIRQPFRIGDQIVSGSFEGTVEKIETRATLIKSYDGRRIVVPNSKIYTEPIIVKTAFDTLRSEYDIGIGCNDDWEKAKELMLKAAGESEGVLSDPAPEVIPTAIADFANVIRLRWWTESDRASVIHTFGRVVENVYKALDDHAIDMPYPTHVVLFHDQTEETDGHRAKQREGWPAGSKGKSPKTDRIGEALRTRADRGAETNDGAKPDQARED